MPAQFDLMGSGYEQTLISHPHIRQAEVDYILGSINPSATKAVLDFAAGSGFLTLKLAEIVERDVRIIAVDSSQKMLGFLKEKLGKTDRIECLLSQDPTLQELPSASFDVITSLGGFHHVEDQVTTIRAIFRLLRPGGHAIILDFTDGTPAQRHFDGLVNDFNPTGHAALFLSHSRAINLARHAGCQNVQAHAHKFVWSFASLTEVGSYFVRHHGLSCRPDEAEHRILSTFHPTIDDNGIVNVEFDYTELSIYK